MGAARSNVGGQRPSMGGKRPSMGRQSMAAGERKSSTGVRRSNGYSNGGGSRSDSRPLMDKAYLNASLHKLADYLSSHGYDQPINNKNLTRPSGRDFNNIMGFLFRQIDPNYMVSGKQKSRKSRRTVLFADIRTSIDSCSAYGTAVCCSTTRMTGCCAGLESTPLKRG